MNVFGGGKSLLSAAEKGDLPQVQSVLKNKPQLIEHKSFYGNNALHNAAANGRLNVVVWLVQHGKARPEILDGKGKTALQRAANNGHTQVVQFLQQQQEQVTGSSNHDIPDLATLEPIQVDSAAAAATGTENTASRRNDLKEGELKSVEELTNGMEALNKTKAGDEDHDDNDDEVIVDENEQESDLAQALQQQRTETQPSPSLFGMVGSGLRSSVTAVGSTVVMAGSTVGNTMASLGSSTKKAFGFGMGNLTIAIDPVIYQPGRDSIEGVVRLVNVPEPFQGNRLVVRLQAFREVTRYDREGRARRSNQQVHNYGQELGGARTYQNNQQFPFVLPVPVLERRLSQGQNPGSVMGTVLGAVDAIRTLSQQPLKWRVTASLSIPYSVGLGRQVAVVVAEPGQMVPPTRRVRAPASFRTTTNRHHPYNPTPRAPRTTTANPPAAAATANTAANDTAAPSNELLVLANGHLCHICYMEEHDEGVLAVVCDNQHYLCQPCFSQWVDSQSDVNNNPQKIILNGGKIYCVCRQTDDCTSPAFGNKLIATAVSSDEIYEKYLRARDFVVGKEAVAGALSHLVGGGGDAAATMTAVEQEQIRNMYRTGDGSYATYMCGQCRFGPIDHGWCNNLATHHGEEKQRRNAGTEQRSVVNNACPNCGWFANNISAWPRWDGTFQVQEA